MENVLRDYFRVILYQWLYIISVEVNRHYVINELCTLFNFVQI